MSETPKIPHEFSEPVREAAESILSPEDRTVVEFGLHALRDFLEKKKKDELPSVIIFPETSARPLYYAVAPIVKEVYAQEHLPLPNFHFLLVIRSPESVDIANTEDLSMLKEEIKQLEKMRYSSWNSNSGIPYEVYKERQKDAERQMIQKRLAYARLSGWSAVQEERFADILRSAPSGDVLFVDDFLGRGETLAQIEETIKIVAPDRRFDFFFFYDGRQHVPRDASSHLSSGLTRDELALKFKELCKYNGFAFGGRPTNPWDPAPEKPVGLRRKAEVLGVEKPSTPQKTVLRAPDRDQKAMGQLRNEMSTIAKKVLADTEFDRSAAIEKLEMSWMD